MKFKGLAWQAEVCCIEEGPTGESHHQRGKRDSSWHLVGDMAMEG